MRQCVGHRSYFCGAVHPSRSGLSPISLSPLVFHRHPSTWSWTTKTRWSPVANCHGNTYALIQGLDPCCLLLEGRAAGAFARPGSKRKRQSGKRWVQVLTVGRLRAAVQLVSGLLTTAGDLMKERERCGASSSALRLDWKVAPW